MIKTKTVTKNKYIVTWLLDTNLQPLWAIDNLRKNNKENFNV